VPLSLFLSCYLLLASCLLVLLLRIRLSLFFLPQWQRRQWWLASPLPLPPPLATSKAGGVLRTSGGRHSPRRVGLDDLLHAAAVALLLRVAAAAKSTADHYWGRRGVDGRKVVAAALVVRSAVLCAIHKSQERQRG